MRGTQCRRTSESVGAHMSALTPGAKSGSACLIWNARSLGHSMSEVRGHKLEFVRGFARHDQVLMRRRRGCPMRPGSFWKRIGSSRRGSLSPVAAWPCWCQSASARQRLGALSMSGDALSRRSRHSQLRQKQSRHAESGKSSLRGVCAACRSAARAARYHDWGTSATNRSLAAALAPRAGALAARSTQRRRIGSSFRHRDARVDARHGIKLHRSRVGTSIVGGVGEAVSRCASAAGADAPPRFV